MNTVLKRISRETTIVIAAFALLIAGCGGGGGVGGSGNGGSGNGGGEWIHFFEPSEEQNTSDSFYIYEIASDSSGAVYTGLKIKGDYNGLDSAIDSKKRAVQKHSSGGSAGWTKTFDLEPTAGFEIAAAKNVYVFKPNEGEVLGTGGQKKGTFQLRIGLLNFAEGAADGGFYVGGYEDTVEDPLLLAKYDASGQKQWDTEICKPNEDECDSITGIDDDSSGAVYVTYIHDDPVLKKLSSSGEEVWAKTGDEAPEAIDRLVVQNETVYIGGGIYDGGDESDVYLASYSLDGENQSSSILDTDQLETFQSAFFDDGEANCFYTYRKTEMRRETISLDGTRRSKETVVTVDSSREYDDRTSLKDATESSNGARYIVGEAYAESEATIFGKQKSGDQVFHFLKRLK